ncbi:Crp/Fnr family transcriptional regulator [Rhodocaloribacter litoris]|uniref:Crp/Fnr family transcriptional regulator n=1 Tax=Rhodocaloribacter litoris TaxID=2558931 RepID=UPI00141F9C65|nr:Crp/Fnr family transcriptional regulator [Rhodocaloribacter litoris]QXD13964.1 Crp/Fnr family transcriptional regulator [Rhodocaloribacter litoris]
MSSSDAFKDEVYTVLPFLRTAPAALREAFFARAIRADMPAGRHLCMEGDRCLHLPIVLAGSARIYKIGGQGREITLYRLEPGDSCILTASCLIGNHDFPAFAITETDVVAALVPATDFLRWLGEHAAWRTYVFGLLWNRLVDVISLVEEVTFRRMDARLAEHLLKLTGNVVGTIHTTHEALADELGTAREVVSRILKEFERQGWVALSRGTIRVCDPRGLLGKARQN